jgi:coenzyme Q-binding protein COQ10
MRESYVLPNQAAYVAPHRCHVIKRVGRTLPFDCEQVFDLAADIECYPEYLTGYVAARITKRDANVCYVEQVVGFGPVRLQFTSVAALHRPERIDVTSTDASFRHFSLSWLIVPASPSGCRIGITTEIELRSRLLQQIVKQLLPAAVDDIIAAFEARAHHKYAGRSGRSPRIDIR